MGFDFYEFFAGGGMARQGLGPGWRCLFANDFDRKKGTVYEANWGSGALRIADIRSLKASDLPGRARAVWASFPCQDLSLAGGGAGLRGERSGMFWPFWELVTALRKDDRQPDVVVLENVCGTLTSHGGKDFTTICSALAGGGYSYGALVIDAKLFVPQSRPRLFVVAVRSGTTIPAKAQSAGPNKWHPASLQAAHGRLGQHERSSWVWWAMPQPRTRRAKLERLLESDAVVTTWHSREETDALLELMSPRNRRKVDDAIAAGKRRIGTVYRRTRPAGNGAKAQRAEARFDGVAGCLRTPAGGSSRQVILVVDRGVVRSRLITSRETGRLMGLPDHFKLPENYNEAYRLTGDGVVVPVVRHLAANLLEPVLLAVAATGAGKGAA